MQAIRIAIPTDFQPFVDAGIVRLGYLHPELDWSFDAESHELVATPTDGTPPPTSAVKREALFQLYRERIHRETLEIRQRIYEAVT